MPNHHVNLANLQPPFAKGHPKIGGRKRGGLNKVTREIKEFACAMIEDPIYVQSLRRRLRTGQAPHVEILLFHHAFGRPQNRVEVKNSGASLRDYDLSKLTTDSLRALAQLLASAVQGVAAVVELEPARADAQLAMAADPTSLTIAGLPGIGNHTEVNSMDTT